MRIQIGGFLLLLLLVVACSNGSEKQEAPVQAVVVDTTPPPKTERFGFILENFKVAQDTVENNWTLSHMLLPFGVSQQKVNEIAKIAKDSAGFKYVAADHPFTMLCTKDTSGEVQYCVYEKNNIEYFVFDLTDSLKVYKGERDVTVKERAASGVITSSLWNAFVDNGLTPALVSKASALYAWSIDFFGIQKGDYFKIVFEERFVEGKFVGVGRIKSILFNHYGQDYYAFHFEKDSVAGYFDEMGESLRKALLQAPLEYTRISSKFSNSRLHPVLKIRRPHHGVDYAAPTGTPVVSVGDGTVIFAGRSGGAGNMVKIQHNNKILTKYLHLSKFGPGIKKGVRVKQGQLIGKVGSTGISTGPHLDYRLYINGKAVDPLNADIPSSDPLSAEFLEIFKAGQAALKKELDQIALPETAKVEATDPA